MDVALRRREQEVWQACDDLWALYGEFKSLTGDAIRDRLVDLGKSRGSPNEIYKYRKTWVKSRGIQNYQSTHGDDIDPDPISRAVHLVHEKLQEETNAEIERIKTEALHQLADKEQEILALKQSLDNVIKEFGSVEEDFKKSQAEKSKVHAQWCAETDLRKAVEQQLAHAKHTYDQQQRAHEQIVTEIKRLNEEQIAVFKQHSNSIEQQAKAEIKTLQEEKKQLGYEYSEQLNQVKMDLYNREILHKSLENKLAEVSLEMAEGLELKERETKDLLIHNQKLMQELQKLVIENDFCRAESKKQLDVIKCLEKDLKKAQLSLARLRAWNSRS